MLEKLSRRDFLRASGLSALTLTAISLHPTLGCRPSGGDGANAPSAAQAGSAQPRISYGDWRDVYADKWSWDRISHCSHTRANCLSACAWNVYVKDGVVWREEQAQAYDHGGRDGAPDFFPRGCQKGACYSEQMANPARLRYPLKRVGKRGSGKWKRIDWDEALDMTADAIIDAASEHGPESVIQNLGSNFDLGPGSAAEIRFTKVIGATILDSFSGIGDMPLGCIQTWGMFLSGGTADDWFNSDYIIIWSANPIYTRIPDMHFLTETRYRGARVVVIAPDYSPSSQHADLWINPRVESDPALGLAMAQVIIAEDLVDEDYIREQTDLPFLVRRSNGRFLRESDIKSGGRDDAFYIWDEKRSHLALAPGCQGRKTASLALKGLVPALSGRHSVTLADKTSVEVETVYDRLRRDLDRRYTPELAEAITGVSAELIRTVARDTAKAGAATIYASVGTCKHYHSDLMHRAMALIMALTGNQGRPGGGLRFGFWWGVTGFEKFSQMFDTPWWQDLLLKVIGRPAVRDVEGMITNVTSKEPFTPLLPWLYVHGGYAEAMGNASYNDVENPLSCDQAMKAAVDRGWMPIYPKPGNDPQVFIMSSTNPLRRWPAPQLALEHLWPKLKLVVSVNIQMSTTGLHSDLLLPAAGYYEKEGIKYAWGMVPYLVLDDKAVEPLGESRNEWWIFGTLTKRIQDRARARHLKPVDDAFGKQVDLSQAFDAWSEHGTYDPVDQRPAMDYIFKNSEICEHTSWDEAIKRGVIPIKRNGFYSVVNNACSDVDPERALYPHAWQVEQKESWPTITGRQQFYLDHPWYINAGEALPVHKDPPAAGGDYPLRMTGGHTRWSIHAIWRSNDLLQRLQRGEPVIYVNDGDANERGLADNTRVRVFNDVGSFECLLKPSASVQRGQAIIYHAWEPHQFRKHEGQQAPIASPWKSLHLVGDYGQLHYRYSYGAPNFSPRGTAIEIESV